MSRLEVIDLRAGYGRREVLSGVSFVVEAATSVAVLGTNGAGKSTLLSALAGLVPITGGAVLLDAVDVTRQVPAARVRRGMVLLQGGRAVFPELSVADNLRIGGYLLGRERAARCGEVLELFPILRSRYRQRAGTLSGGEQHQLALAKSLLLQPRLLLVDELSLGLAPGALELLAAILREVNEAGTTLVVVEQGVDPVAALCPRALVLEKGRVRLDVPTSELDAAALGPAAFLDPSRR